MKKKNSSDNEPMRPNVNEDSHCKERTSCARRQGNQENREISVGFKKALKNSKTGSVTWPIFKIKTCPEKNILKLIDKIWSRYFSLVWLY